jgi:uncharacterized protein YndB with AHSA1/START domain
MRFADGPAVEVELHIDAPASRVWELVTDITLPARFSEEFQGAEWVEPATGPAVGAQFRGHNRHRAIGEWTTTPTVTQCDTERAFAWVVGDPEHPSALWRFELTGDGTGTNLRQYAKFGPGPSGLTAVIERMPEREERIIERRLEEHKRNMTATLEGIKAIAEGGS